jgi:hypothetical protein
MEAAAASSNIRRVRSTWERCSACTKVHGPSGQLYARCFAAFPPSATFVRPIPVAIPAGASGVLYSPPSANAGRRQRTPSPNAGSDSGDGIDGDGSGEDNNASAAGSGSSSSDSGCETGNSGSGADSSDEENALPPAPVAVDQVVNPPLIAMVHPIAAPPFAVGVHSTTKNTTQLWNVVSSVNSEIAAPLAVPTINSKFRWNVIGLQQDSVKTELDHFRLWDVSPTQDIGGDGKSMIDLTNDKIDAMPFASRRGTGTVDIGEWYQFTGIRLAASLEHASGNMGHHWSDTPEDGTTYRANNFGTRFGMSLNRFQTIDASLVFSRPNTVDPWAPIGDYVQLFNVRRKLCLQGCGHLTFDESGSKWRGKNGHYHIDGLPHVTKCPQKPEPFNLEFKNFCDGDTGIMMVLISSCILFYFVQKRS